MSLHPVVQLQVGDQPIQLIPPNYVQSLVYTSVIHANAFVEIKAIDPTYVNLETFLIGADYSKEPILIRFGYLGTEDQIMSDWIQTQLVNFSPELDHKGTEISANFMIYTNEDVVLAKTKSYSGRISSVVRQIAEDAGLHADIEETNDDINEAHPENNGNPKVWSTGPLTTLEFIRQHLLPIARSKTSKGEYRFWISPGGSHRDKRPTLHFHTFEHRCPVREKGIKEFSYLINQQQQVLEFRPTFASNIIGNVGGSQTVMRAWDASSKRFVSKAQNTRTNPEIVSVGDGSGDSTRSTPVTEEGVNEDLVSQGGFHITTESRIEDAVNRAEITWGHLRNASDEAVLTLLGAPDTDLIEWYNTTDIEANDLIRVNCMIPTLGNAEVLQRHWSSGLYIVKEVVHDISSRYVVTCQLQRSPTDNQRGVRFVP